MHTWNQRLARIKDKRSAGALITVEKKKLQKIILAPSTKYESDKIFYSSHINILLYLYTNQ